MPKVWLFQYLSYGDHTWHLCSGRVNLLLNVPIILDVPKATMSHLCELGNYTNHSHQRFEDCWNTILIICNHLITLLIVKPYTLFSKEYGLKCDQQPTGSPQDDYCIVGQLIHITLTCKLVHRQRFEFIF